MKIQSYQNFETYIKGDLVWYQPPSENSWLGPAAVLCHRGPSVWLHTVSDIKKVASCKPYELIMMEDSLEDVENILDQEIEA